MAATGLVLAGNVAPAGAATPEKAVAMPASVTAALLAVEDNDGDNVGVAVLDTETGQYYGSVGAETEFPSESVVKVLIAANLLATGQMSGATEQMAYQMITESDDDDADALWGQVGGAAVETWAAQHYGISDLGAPPTQPGWWGNTKFTAHGLVELYADIKADPVVGPWLINAMSHMAAAADDGTDQDFGLAAQTTMGAFKQGWGGDDDNDNSEQLNSTGLLENDRYAVAILVQHLPYEPMSQLMPDLDSVTAAVAPGGNVVMPAPPAPAPVQSVEPAANNAKVAHAPSATSPTASATPPAGKADANANAPASLTSPSVLTADWRHEVLPGLGIAVGVCCLVLLFIARRRKEF